MQHHDDVPFIPQSGSRRFIQGPGLLNMTNENKATWSSFKMFPHKVEELRDYNKMEFVLLELKVGLAILQQFEQEQKFLRSKRKTKNSKATIIQDEEHQKTLQIKKFIMVSCSKGVTNQEVSAYHRLKAG